MTTNAGDNYNINYPYGIDFSDIGVEDEHHHSEDYIIALTSK